MPAPGLPPSRTGGTDVLDRPSGATEARAKPKAPDPWRAVLHNNDVTPFEVVLISLVEVFRLDGQRAAELMMQAHERGRAVVMVSTREVVETKCEEGNAKASSLWDGPALFAPEKGG